ncbi:MAG: ABC transporter permease [Spirochaetaceae bacterium]|jgi:simple sugar transport system permease protein|nr:ABC transporter permease [Spirochaetaceae bacterium]
MKAKEDGVHIVQVRLTKDRWREHIANFGLPRLIIFSFIGALFIAAPFVGVRVDTSLTNVMVRFGQNAVMVLAMVPMMQAGTGLNFGLPVGIIAGLLGATLAMQFRLTGILGFMAALGLSLPFALVFGILYGMLLNKVKGEEMTIALYIGFSIVTFMAILWLLLPFTNPTMVWGYTGEGLRTTITLEGYWAQILNNFLAIRIGEYFMFPTGSILFFILMAFILWLFMHSKTGTALTAVGSNPVFAYAGGVSINRMRLISVVVSTIYGAIGILVYQQSFGFIQVYQAPLYMAFPAVAAILLGGASVNKASIGNVIVGTFLFQSLLTMTPSVINNILQTDMSEVIRILISNGMIIYALTRKTRQAR